MAAEHSAFPRAGLPAGAMDTDEVLDRLAQAIAATDDAAILALAATLQPHQHALATRVLRIATHDLPANEGLWHAYARLAEHNGDWADAINRWWLARKHHPHSLATHLGYIEAAVQAGRTVEAQRATDSAIEALGQDPALHALQARIAAIPPPETGIDAPAIAPEEREQVRKLLLGFESLGRNCEFGILQRQFGGEPLGLMRFASTNLRSLMILLRTNFAGMGEADATELVVGDGEYRLHHIPSGWRMHTRIYQKSTPDRDRVLAEQLRHSRFLRSKLVRELRNASKIFVYWKTDLADAEADRLYHVLQSHGPNMLMCVRLADQANPVGSVVWRQPRLMVAAIDRQGQEFGGTGWDISTERWIAFCRIAAARRDELRVSQAA